MEFDPLGIFLATVCTGGEKLLFRYPNEVDENHNKPNIVLSSHSYALKMNLIPQYSVCKENQLTNIKNGIVVGFEDFLLANLLTSSKSYASKRRYEVKVGDVIFVGFLHEMVRNTKFERKNRTEKITFNVVFALQAGINSHFIPLYQDLSEKISLALIHEEERTAFMSREKQAIVDLHETMQQAIQEKTTDKSLNVHERTSVECSLGVFLKYVYESICEFGNVDLFLNNWVRISFTISPKVPRGIVTNGNGSGKRPLLFPKPSMLQDYLREMRPYHSFILLEDRRIILDRLTMDCSPVLMRLLRAYNPLKSIDQLAAELDVALTQVRQVLCSLIVWGLAMLIYPVFDSNIYLVSPSANLAVNSACNMDFSIQFPHLSLPRVLEEFSSPFTFGNHREFLGSPREQGQDTKVLIWLMQRKLIYQLHTYPYLDPFFLRDEIPSPRHPSIRGVMSSSSSSGVMDSEFMKGQVLSDSMMMMMSSYGNNGSPEDVSAFNSFDKKNDDSMKEEETFCRLASTYFNGLYHLEAIMYWENISRTSLCHLIDRFRDRLYVIKHEEHHISYWVSPDI